jgi:hypothetical protein
MSPWEELTYFQSIAEKALGSITDTNTPSIPANPQRIWICFAVGPNGQTANVSTNPAPGASSGFSMFSQQPLMITHADFPGLPQKAWFVRAIAPAVLTAWLGEMRDWPVEDSPDGPTNGDWDNTDAQGAN